MIGESPYLNRAELIQQVATGVRPEPTDAQQRIFAEGHRIEALARPVAEGIIGEELYPTTGSAGKLSASFDGLSLMEDTGFEHKTINQAIRDAIGHDGATGADLPLYLRIQMEQQAAVSGCERILFMASKWTGYTCDEELHVWYYPDMELRARIVAGWEQFESDVAAYQPSDSDTVAPAATGAAPETLPALHVEAEGKVIASNLDAYRDHAMKVLESINRELKTDDDFADAEATVKWCSKVEDKLSAAKDSVLGQMATVDDVCRTIDDLSAETRRVRLDLNKLVKAEKERRKNEIVEHYVDHVRKHYEQINETLGAHALGAPANMRGIFTDAIKGKRTLGGITDAADTAAANAKIEASQQAERIRAGIAVLDEFADHASLFADRVQLCATKSADDLRNLAKARVADHEESERQRLEAERQRIRDEEQAKAQREADAKAHAEAQRKAAAERAAVKPQVDTSTMHVDQAPPTGTSSESPDYAAELDKVWPAEENEPVCMLKMSNINDAIAPLSITAAGLAELGIEPADKKGAARLYSSNDLPKIFAAMLHVINKARDEYRLGEVA